MDEVILRTGFAGVTHAINFDPQKVKNGKALAVSHVQRVEELGGLGDSRLLRCSIVRTTTVGEHPYKVQLELNGERHITNTSCTCVSGIAKKCKHIYALIHYINTDRSSSKTDVEQEWGKPTDAQLGKELYAKPLVIADAFKLKISKDILVVETINVTYSDLIGICCPLQQVLKVQSFNVNKFFIRDIIKDMISMAIDKSATSKIEACANILVNLSSSSIIYEPGMNILDEKLRKYYDEQIHVSEGEVIKICVETVSQSESTVWFDTRKKRISASSKAHAIKARKRKEITKLISEFLSSENKQGIRSLEYGLKYEKIALDEYNHKLNL